MTTMFKANQQINKAVTEQWPLARVRKEITDIVLPVMTDSVKTLQAGLRKIQWHGESIPIEQVSPDLQTKALQLQRFILDAEGRLNAMHFKNSTIKNVGTELKERWMKTLFKGASEVKFICNLTNIEDHQNEQQKVIETIRHNKPTDDGAREMLATLTSKSFKVPENSAASVLLSFMHGLKESVSYELYTRVDAYLLSGYAENDLKGTSSKTANLRKAFEQLDKYPVKSPEYNKALIEATKQLYTRFDGLFKMVKIRNGEAHVEGTIGNYKKKQALKNGNVEVSDPMFQCQQLSAPGYVDVAIEDFKAPGQKDQPTRWHFGLASSNTSPDHLIKEGEQLQDHVSALKKMCDKQGSTMAVTFVAKAKYKNSSKKVKEFYEHLGITEDRDAIKALDNLTMLSILSARGASYVRASETRFLTGGQGNTWNTITYTPQTWSESVYENLAVLIPKYVDEGATLNAGDKGSNLFNETAKLLGVILAANRHTPAIEEHFDTFNAWGAELNKKVRNAEIDADIHGLDINTLSVACSAIQPPVQNATYSSTAYQP